MPASDCQYVLSTDPELGAGLCNGGAREADALRLCTDVNIHGESQVEKALHFMGALGGLGIRKVLLWLAPKE